MTGSSSEQLRKTNLRIYFKSQEFLSTEVAHKSFFEKDLLSCGGFCLQKEEVRDVPASSKVRGAEGQSKDLLQKSGFPQH